MPPELEYDPKNQASLSEQLTMMYVSRNRPFIKEKKKSVSLGPPPFLQDLLCCVLDLWWDYSCDFRYGVCTGWVGIGGHWQPYFSPPPLSPCPALHGLSCLKRYPSTFSEWEPVQSRSSGSLCSVIKGQIIALGSSSRPPDKPMRLSTRKHGSLAADHCQHFSCCFPPGLSSPRCSWICCVISPHVTSVSQKLDGSSTQVQRECHWNQRDEGTRGDNVIQCLVV